jgi:hypothetical protein
MRNSYSLLVTVLFSLLAIAIGNPVMFKGGVIEPGSSVTFIDSAKMTFHSYPDETFLTPGWGSHTPLDTFIFAGVPPAWPDTILLCGTVNSFPVNKRIVNPTDQIWYELGMGVIHAHVQFGEYPGVEESRSLARRPMFLAVCPSIVTRQMTIRLQPVGTGRPSVEIHDAAGNLVRSLDFTAAAEGAATAIWNREDEFGHLVPEGVYFCRYAASDVIAVRKVLVAH